MTTHHERDLRRIPRRLTQEARMREHIGRHLEEGHPITRETARLIAACNGHRWEIGYHLLLTYGMRRGEVLGLRWSDIDFERDIIHVRQQLQCIHGVLQTGPVKTSAGKRDLPLLLPIRNRFLALHDEREPQPDDLVLLSTAGTPVDPKNFVRTFDEIRDRQACHASPCTTRDTPLRRS